MGCMDNKGKEALASLILAVFNAEQNVDEEKFHAVDKALEKYGITPEHIKKGRKLVYLLSFYFNLKMCLFLS